MASMNMPGQEEIIQLNLKISPASPIVSGEILSPRDVATQFDRCIGIKRSREVMEGSIPEEKFLDALDRPIKPLCQLSGMDGLGQQNDIDQFMKKVVDARFGQFEKEMDARLDQCKKDLFARLDQYEKKLDARLDQLLLHLEKKASEVLNNFGDRMEMEVNMNLFFKIDDGVPRSLTSFKNEINDMVIRIDCGFCRLYNILSVTDINGKEKIWPLPKTIAGHPPGFPPSVLFYGASYELGALPPNYLFPRTFRYLRFSDEEVIMHSIRALHWFYNDDRISPQNKTPTECRAAFEKFVKFN